MYLKAKPKSQHPSKENNNNISSAGKSSDGGLDRERHTCCGIQDGDQITLNFSTRKFCTNIVQ